MIPFMWFVTGCKTAPWILKKIHVYIYLFIYVFFHAFFFLNVWDVNESFCFYAFSTNSKTSFSIVCFIAAAQGAQNTQQNKCFSLLLSHAGTCTAIRLFILFITVINVTKSHYVFTINYCKNKVMSLRQLFVFYDTENG